MHSRSKATAVSMHDACFAAPRLQVPACCMCSNDNCQTRPSGLEAWYTLIHDTTSLMGILETVITLFHIHASPS